MTDLKTQSVVLVIANNSKEAKKITGRTGYLPGEIKNTKDLFNRGGSSIHDETLFNLIGEEVFEWGEGHHGIDLTQKELEDHDILSDGDITINFIISRADPDVGLMEDYISHVMVSFDIWEVELV
tara:strand:- start:403 stop:777 length:375 start_codon:yes stop_codon:yes gene_type:complete